MKIALHHGLKHAEVVQASRAVIYDNFDNILAVFLQIDANHIEVRVRGTPGFEEALKFLGIEQTTVVQELSKKDLPTVQL